MNSFDAVVYLALVVAVIVGFNAGLLRSAITILAYLFATPLALWIMSLASPMIGAPGASLTQSSLLFFGIFLAVGMLLGKLARMALDEVIGSEAGIGDRLAGAALGAVRVGLVATTLVLIFDRLVPADRQPPPHRLAAAPAAVDRGPARLSIFASRRRSLYRSAEAGSADIGIDTLSYRYSFADMRSGQQAATYQGRLTWIQCRNRTAKNHLT